MLAPNADSTPAPSGGAIDQVPAAVCRLHWCHSAPPARISENSNPCSSSPRASIVIDWTVPSRSPSSWCVSQRASYRLPTLSAIPPLCMHHPQPTPDLIDRSRADHIRPEEQTSELPSLLRIPYAVSCLKK